MHVLQHPGCHLTMPACTPRPRRTALYIPALNARAIAKSRQLPCDVVILDLEDSIDPGAKIEARHAAVAAVREGGWATREVVVRVNAWTTEWGRDDLLAIAEAGPDAVLVPKISGPAEIQHCDRYLATATAELRLWAMVETALCIFAVADIAAMAAETRLSGLVAGTNDLALETGWQLDVGRAPALAALSLAVAAARAHGLAVLDGVYNEIDDEAGLQAQCTQGFQYGFDGKTLIHRKQIETCRECFTPTGQAIAYARAICDAFALPENEKRGVIRLNGHMFERLHLEQARRVLRQSGMR